MTDRPTRELSRRDALKLFGAAAGATVLANLPSKWSTPALTAGVLPAHAQTSFVGCEGLGIVYTVQWGPDVDLDAMLLVPVPGQFLVTPKAYPPAPVPQGTSEPFTATAHGGDDTGGAGTNSETIIVPTGNLINGLWVFFVFNPEENPVPVHIVLSGACTLELDIDVLPGLSGDELVVEDCQALCPTITSLSAREF
jgi:hypothetical protein